MYANAITPNDRASFDSAMTAILADHATLRRLAVEAAKESDIAADAAMSLADAMFAHESAEARLFALPFVTRPPETVTSSASRARQRCLDYTSGNFRLPDPGAARALFVDALLTHLAVEDTWLAREQEHQNERRLISD